MSKQLKSYSTVDDARAFAAFAYSGLEDKAGLDYLAHPVRVWETVKRRGGVPYIQVAALLHDVLEDTVIEAEQLLELGFHKDAVDVIELLTRDGHSGRCDVIDLCDLSASDTTRTSKSTQARSWSSSLTSRTTSTSRGCATCRRRCKLGFVRSTRTRSSCFAKSSRENPCTSLHVSCNVNFRSQDRKAWPVDRKGPIIPTC